jgi:Bacterial regulatory proteins, tetR family
LSGRVRTGAYGSLHTVSYGDGWGKGGFGAAALAAIAKGGLAAVAVEPLAARLGATKGSFYWHLTWGDGWSGVLRSADAVAEDRRVRKQQRFGRVS